MDFPMHTTRYEDAGTELVSAAGRDVPRAALRLPRLGGRLLSGDDAEVGWRLRRGGAGRWREA